MNNKLLICLSGLSSVFAFDMDLTKNNPIQQLTDYVTTNYLEKPDIKLEFDPGITYWMKRWIYIQRSKNGYQFMINENKVNIPIDDKQKIVPWTYYGIPFKKVYTTINLT